jgi:hypothetical protein
MLTSSKRLRIDHLILMSDESAPLPTRDDLMDNACDLLDLCRRSGLEVGPETEMIRLAIAEQNYTRLEKLIARVNTKIQDGSAAASAAIVRHSEPDTSSVAEPQNRIQTQNAAIPAPYPAIRTTSKHYAEHASLAQCRHIMWNQRTRGVQNQDQTFR